MEGGMTRRRGYLWFTAALLAVLLAIVFFPSNKEHETSDTILAVADTLSLPATKVRNRHRYPPQQRLNTNARLTQPADRQPDFYPTSVRTSHRTIVELNTADTLDLQQLYNIGPTFSRRIVRYRTLLGGFVNKDQLLEVYGMDTARYADILPYITIDTSAVSKLDINSATIDQLKHHPYLDYYQAKAIVRLRESQGPYRNIGDLLNVTLIDQQTFSKIAPYITCNLQPNK